MVQSDEQYRENYVERKIVIKGEQRDYVERKTVIKGEPDLKHKLVGKRRKCKSFHVRFMVVLSVTKEVLLSFEFLKFGLCDEITDAPEITIVYVFKNKTKRRSRKSKCK